MKQKFERTNDIKEALKQSNQIKAHLNLNVLRSNKDYDREALINSLAMETAKAIKRIGETLYLKQLKRQIEIKRLNVFYCVKNLGEKDGILFLINDVKKLTHANA